MNITAEISQWDKPIGSEKIRVELREKGVIQFRVGDIMLVVLQSDLERAIKAVTQ